MIKSVDFPNREFTTKEELFSELFNNQDRLISLKTSAVYKSAEKNQISAINFDKFESVEKSGFNAEQGYIYPIISTTKYMDSHNDVHFDGCFSKTVKEQQGKVNYCLDHELKWDSIIAWKEDVEMLNKKIDWSLVGKDYDGKTDALIFKISKDKIKRKDVLDAIENKSSAFENSIRMIYVKMKLGMNSQMKEHAENKAYYDARINEIANKERVEEQGYFWGVEELKIWKEGSLVVAGGSNDATAIHQKEEDPEPQKSTLENTETAVNLDTVAQALKELSI